MLWEKEPNGTSYINILGLNDATLIANFEHMKIGRHIDHKRNEWSNQFRLKGNEQVKANKWREAMAFYNKSLCSAEKHTENVSLAYANRSLCFLKMKMYEKCLIDIELAIEAHYPEHLMSKLIERRAHCVDQLRHANKIEGNGAELDFAEHALFPGMANVMKFEYNVKFGRHLIAMHDIDVGKVVIAEEPFVSTPVMSKEKMICSKCFKDTMNFIACDYCSSSMFCSRACAESDEFHELSCGKNIANANHLVAFVARSILLAVNIFPDIDTLIEFVENVTNNEEKCAPLSMADDVSRYRAFLKFNLWLSDEDEDDLYQSHYEVFGTVISNPAVQEKIRTKDDGRFIMHLSLQHLYIVKCNSFQNKLTGGIFLIQKHINHSCAPNLIQYCSANKVVCITSRSIKKGDQLFITYGEKLWFQPRLVRQRLLFQDFGFRCDCEKCSNTNWPISSTRIQLDSDYQLLQKEMKGLDNNDSLKCSFLKEKCLVLLKKYHGMPWKVELDCVSNHFASLLNDR